MATNTAAFSRLDAKRQEQTPQALARLVVVVLFIALWAVLFVARIPMPLPFLAVLVLEAVFFVVYLRAVGWLPTPRSVEIAQYVMLAAEIVFHTTMVYFLGTISWLGAFAYVFGLIFTNTFLDLRRGFVYTTGAALAFASLIILEATGTIPHHTYLDQGPLRYTNAQFVTTTVLGAVGVFFSIYLWVNWVGFQLRQERDGAVRAQDGLLQARADLQRANEELDERVHQRTAELELANTALSEHEARLRTVIDNAPVVLFSVDSGGVFTLAQGSGLTSLGLRPEEVVGRSATELFSSVPGALENIRRALGGESFSKVVTLRGVSFETHHAPLHDEQGYVAGMIGIGTDITERLRAEDAQLRGEEILRQSEAILRGTIESTDDGILVLGAGGEVVHVNARFCDMWEMPDDIRDTHRIDKYVEWTSRRFKHADEVIDRLREAFVAGREGLDTIELNDGRVFESYARPLTHEGSMEGRVFSFRDVTERKAAEETLRESESKFRTMAEAVAAAVLIFQGTKIRYVNSATLDMTGYSREEFMGMDFWEIVHPEYRELVRERGLARQQGADVPSRYELTIVTKRGQGKWVDLTATRIDYEGRPAVLGTAFDITERKQAEEALREHANRDPLTGLLNRRAGRAAIEERLEQARNGTRPFAVLVLDLDKFKSINDTFSHETGDNALLQFTQVIGDLVGDRGVIARLGGDEFEIGMDGLSDDEALAFAEEIQARLAGSFEEAGRLPEVRFTVSIGIASYPNDGDQLVALGRQADKAMYHAKALGGAQICQWREVIDDQAA